MKTFSRFAVVSSLIAWMFAGPVWAESSSQEIESNWHRWRGPHVTGVAPNGNPPTQWDDSTNVQWKVEIPGLGSGSPIVWGDKIFLLTAIDTGQTEQSTEEAAEARPRTAARLVSDTEQPAAEEQRPRGERDAGRERRGGRGGFGGRRGGFGVAQPTNVHQFVVMCLDRNTGEVIWDDVAAEVVPHEGHHGTGSFASSTPVTDGENLYVSFGSRGIYSYDLDGNLRWKTDLGQMRTRLSFGEGASPALHGDTLIVPWDHEGDSRIFALDANSGEIRWEKSRDEPTTWATPLVVEHDGVTQVITPGTNRIRSYDLANGDLLWECGGLGSNPIPTPVKLDNLVICMTGHRDPAVYAIPLDARGDITGSDEVVWSKTRDTPYVSSPLLVDGLLYYVKGNNAIFTCVNAESGDVVYETQRLPELDVVYSSPVLANGHIYISGRNGATVVIKAGSEFEVVTTNDLQETIDATPAIVGDVMYLRTQKHLYALAE